MTTPILHVESYVVFPASMWVALKRAGLLVALTRTGWLVVR